MKICYFLLGLMMATKAAADLPFVVDETDSFRLTGVIVRNGETQCDIALDYHHQLENFPPQKHLTGCHLDAADLSDIRISGTYKSKFATGSFDATFKLFDISPWTAVLRDEGLDFGTRLERYAEGIGAVNAHYSEGFKIRKTDAPDQDAIRALRDDIGAELPPEMEFLITHDVSYFDSSYVGPAYRKRWSGDAPDTWPTLTEIELAGGVRENELPAEGSELRDWYDRVRVVYEHIGDGHAPFVWDPAAEQGEAQYFWLEEDTREVEAFLHIDGTPVNALGTLLTPLQDYGWVEAAIEATGADPYDPNLIVVDTKNPDAVFSVYFGQGSKIPLFRKVIPQLMFNHQTWWPR